MLICGRQRRAERQKPFFELQKNEVKRLKSLSRAQN
jgi:hypothetical protein